MTLQLILLRHAKSSWDDLTLDDFDRPLNARGQRSAAAIGAWLKEADHLPVQTLCSASARTRETYARLGIASDVSFHEGLYHASEDSILRTLQSKATAQSLLLIGHNPGCAAFAEDILKSPLRSESFLKFPTAATLVVSFNAASWQDVRFATGHAETFITPRELLA